MNRLFYCSLLLRSLQTCDAAAGSPFPVSVRQRRKLLRSPRLAAWLNAVAAAVLALPACADIASLQALKGLSLEELANIEVSIASNRNERAWDAAAAVFVLTRDDIRRSGATTLPEVLRGVPGLNVARISASEWAVASRVINSQFAARLLVLIDGRSVYTPLFAGVLWDGLNIVLQDIERIEVIRGPGASTWGANAVNGVINIITRSAADGDGSQVDVTLGGRERELVARTTVATSGDGHVRFHAKAHGQDGMGSPPGITSSDSDWAGGRAGFRGDWDTASGSVLVSGEAYREETVNRELQGAYLLGHLDVPLASGARDRWQGYYQRDELGKWALGLNGLRDATLDTFDLSYRRQFVPLGDHNLTAGTGYRLLISDLTAVAPTAVREPEGRHQWFNVFVQDDITLLPDRLYLTLGGKGEQNSFTHLEWQPSVRLRGTTEAGSTWWAAASRAARIPSLIEDRVTLAAPLTPPMQLQSHGQPDLDAETVLAHELGYRVQVTQNLAVDTTAYRFRYDKLVAPKLIGTSGTTVNYTLESAEKLIVSGLELKLDYRPANNWRIQAAYSYMDDGSAKAVGQPRLGLAGNSPRHQFSLRSSHDLANDTELDIQLRYVGELPALLVGDYTTADVRIARKLGRHVEVSLVGRNLVGPKHVEFGPASRFSGNNYEVPREILASLSWRY